MRQGGGRTTAAAALALAVLSLGVWAHRVYLDPPQRAAVNASDTVRYFHPAAIFIHDELRAGRLPTWNPNQLAGQPYLALHIPGALYPPNLLLMGAFEPVRALEVHAVVHIWLAGWFTWLLAGRLGLSAAGRLAAAVVYMLCGSIWLGVYMTPYLSTPVWLPAILWSLHGLLREGRVLWAIGLAAFLSLAFLGGYAQGFVYMVQMCAVFGLLGLAVWTPVEKRARTIGLAVLSGVLALGFVAPQLLPSIELTRDAVRSFGGLPPEASWTPFFTRTMLADGVLRGLGPGEGMAPGLGPERWRLTLPWLTLPLVGLGFFARGQRAAWIFFLVAACFAGLFVLGPQGKIFRLYYGLPGGDLFRGPGRAAFLYQFSGAMLVGVGVHAVGRMLEARAATRALASRIALAVMGLVAFDAYARTGLDVKLPMNQELGRGAPPELREALGTKEGGPRVFFQAAGYWRPDFLYKAGMMNGLFVVPDYEPSMPGMYARYFDRDPSPVWHGGVTLSAAARPRLPVATTRMLDLMSVRYYAVPEGAPPDVRATLGQLAGGPMQRVGGLEVFERTEARPRAYVVTSVIAEPDPERATARLDAPGFRPAEEAVVGAEPSELAILTANQAADSAEGGDAHITRYGAREVEVEARCPGGCLLILTDLYYPGWRATVDGHDAKILRANTLYRSVLLEPGRHVVRFHFEPTSLRVGLGMASACLLLAWGLAASAWRARRLLPLAGSLLLLSGCGPAPEPSAPRPAPTPGRPNILFILADDLRWDALGGYGNTQVRTPALDRLASEGVVLDRFYVANPVCNASRASFLTGLHTHQAGLRRLKINVKHAAGTPTVATLLNDAGYVTGFIGKAHMGGDPRPWGFQEVPFYTPGHQLVDGPEAWTRYYVDGEEAHIDGDTTAPTVDAAVSFIERHRDERWFLWLATTAPHWPYHYDEAHPYAPAEIVRPPGYPDDEPLRNRRTWADYYSQISTLDQHLGRLLGALRDAGLEGRTLVVFTSDNGLMNGSHQDLWKGVWFEESVRQPAILRWPGKLPAGERSDAAIVSVDMLPTFAEVAGVPPPKGLEARSVLPALQGRAPQRRFAFAQSTLLASAGGGTWNMVRGGRYKYVDFVDRDDVHLFDLETDPHELSDLRDSPEHRNVARRLARQLERWREATGP